VFVRLGDLALLVTMISATIDYAMGGNWPGELGGGPVICWALVMALPIIGVPAWLMAPTSRGAVTPDAGMSFLYIALVSQLFGFFLWNAGPALGGISRVSQTQLIQPFVTIAATALLPGETLEPGTPAFALLMISQVVIVRSMRITQALGVPVVDLVYSRSKGE
jgi:drug/metabolite transporter (DMT)-like permease